MWLAMPWRLTTLEGSVLSLTLESLVDERIVDRMQMKERHWSHATKERGEKPTTKKKLVDDGKALKQPM